MSTVHIVRNQDGHYWGRGKRWVDGRDLPRVATFQHRDEVVNTAFELSSKDVDLRLDILDIDLVEGKLPRLEVSDIPLVDENDSRIALENSEPEPIREQLQAVTPEV